MWPVLEMQATVDDMVEFQRYCMENRPIGRRSVANIRFLRVGLALVCVGVGGVLYARVLGNATWGWPFVFFAIVIGAYSWFSAPRSLVASYRQRLSNRTPSGLMPACRLWIDEWRLNDESARRFTRYAWASVEQVVETPTHAFIWVGEGRAVLVPKRIGEQQVRYFLEAVKAYSVQAQFPWTAEYGASGR